MPSPDLLHRTEADSVQKTPLKAIHLSFCLCHLRLCAASYLHSGPENPVLTLGKSSSHHTSSLRAVTRQNEGDKRLGAARCLAPAWEIWGLRRAHGCFWVWWRDALDPRPQSLSPLRNLVPCFIPLSCSFAGHPQGSALRAPQAAGAPAPPATPAGFAQCLWGFLPTCTGVC